MLISHDDLLSALRYDAESGSFFWKIKKNSYGGKVSVGSVAGHVNKNGYISIRLNGQLHLAHRLAWFYVHREWPPLEIDHVNGCPSDNRLSNLRCVDSSQNGFNTKTRKDNVSGHKGVSWGKSVNKWVVRIGVNGKYKHLGCFSDLSDAVCARKEAEALYHGEYARSA